MKVMKVLLMPMILIIGLFSWSCIEKSPIDIRQLELNLPGSNPGINTADQTDGTDFSIGYYNGNIQTDRIFLEWTESNDGDFAYYKVYKAIGQLEDDPPFVLLQVYNDRDSTAIVDSTLVQDQYYVYKVATFTDNGMSQTENIEIKTPLWQAPDNFTINGFTTTAIELAWNDNTESESGFKVYVDTLLTLREYVTIDSFTLEQDVTNLFFNDLPTTAEYLFRIYAFGDWEEDTPIVGSAPFSFTDLVFNAPSNLNLAQEAETIAVLLNWTDNSNLETGFEIERKINSSDYEVLTLILDYNTIEYTDDDTTAYGIGDTIYYKVRAYNPNEDPQYTAYSNEASVIIDEPAFVPDPEYFINGNTWMSLSIDYSGETDIFEWTSNGSDLDVEIYNNSVSMDLAIRVWDENGVFLGDFNTNGTGLNDYFYNIADGNIFIAEVYDLNNTSGNYDIFFY